MSTSMKTATRLKHAKIAVTLLLVVCCITSYRQQIKDTHERSASATGCLNCEVNKLPVPVPLPAPSGALTTSNSTQGFINVTKEVQGQQPAYINASEFEPSYYFVSGRFSADNRFTRWVEKVRASMVNISLFPQENIFTYSVLPDFILNDKRFEEHLKFLTDAESPSHRGAGYWFWKPLLIQDTLKKMKDGDFMAYLDIDEALLHMEFASVLFRKMREREANFAVVQLKYQLRDYAKRDIYNKHCPGLDLETDTFLEKEAGRVLIRKSPVTVQFIDNWVEAVSDYHLVSDEDSHAENVKRYLHNHHDQSLMSALMECGTPRPTQEFRINLCDEIANNTLIKWNSNNTEAFCQGRQGYHAYTLK